MRDPKWNQHLDELAETIKAMTDDERWALRTTAAYMLDGKNICPRHLRVVALLVGLVACAEREDAAVLAHWCRDMGYAAPDEEGWGGPSRDLQGSERVDVDAENPLPPDPGEAPGDTPAGAS